MVVKADLARLALELPIEEQLDLAQTQWDHASPPADFTLTPELKELIEARFREAQADPEAGIPWENIKARLLRRTRLILSRLIPLTD
jgi:putative addiction module component (TIGR02574 family)